jgi:uncharacterized protein (UPF0216 family)
MVMRMAASGPPVDRWLSLEVGRVNDGLVVERKSLRRLLDEPKPTCRTRGGHEVVLDRAALERLAAAVPRHERDVLRLPITIFVSGDLEDSAYISEELAAKTIRKMEGFEAAFPFRDGRMYLPHSLAVDLVRRSGGTLQIAYA